MQRINVKEEAKHLRCGTDHLVGFLENIQILEDSIAVERKSTIFAYCHT